MTTPRLRPALFVAGIVAIAFCGLAAPAAAESPLREIRESIRAVWTTEIVAVEGHSITVGSVLVAIFLLVLGGTASRRLAAGLVRRAAPRFGLDTGATAAVETLVFYLLLALFLVWALHIVSIPLTVFTVVGGALAIGVGFGSQNVVNNFISGLILMVERPVKVGDVIEFAGASGTVQRMGARSTLVRSGDNTHVIVPNSHFLENPVTNWTLTDDLVRTSIDVGVAYGSPTEAVAELLLEACRANTRTQSLPAPEVLFLDFGADALQFRLYFWLHIHAPLDRQRAQSELRFAIDRLFRERGIVIAFPQRDVHLDASRPLAVRVVPDSPGG